MGNWFSLSEAKNFKSDGQVNNNVIVEERPGGKFEAEMLILTAIICALRIFEFVVYVYKRHTKYKRDRHKRNLVLGDNKK